MFQRYKQLAEQVYTLALFLPRLNHSTPAEQLPEDGIYLLFERGEQVSLGNRLVERIVGVGINEKPGRFPGRIRQHFGSSSSLNGNRRSSVLRKHVGGALLRKLNSNDSRLEHWVRSNGPPLREVEHMVSQLLRDTFTFVCFPVTAVAEGVALKKGLVSLLARYQLGEPSPDWLGRFATNERIRLSGLWNAQDIDSEPLTLGQYQRLRHLAGTVTVNAGR